MLLAAAGLFASLSFDVARRRLELAVRRALGATPSDVTAVLLRSGLAPVVYGIALGLPGALLARRSYASYLFGMSPLSLAPYLVSSLTLFAVDVLVCPGPARAAARRPPAEILRCD